MLLLIHKPRHQDLYHVTSITQTEHHSMKDDTDNRLSLFWSQSMPLLLNPLHQDLRQVTYDYSNIEDCVTKHDAEDWTMFIPVYVAASHNTRTFCFVYMLIFAHTSHLFDRIYQYPCWNNSNNSVHQKRQHLISVWVWHEFSFSFEFHTLNETEGSPLHSLASDFKASKPYMTPTLWTYPKGLEAKLTTKAFFFNGGQPYSFAALAWWPSTSKSKQLKFLILFNYFEFGGKYTLFVE